MKPIFDQRMFCHVNATLAKERGNPSRAVAVMERAFSIGPLVLLVRVLERIYVGPKAELRGQRNPVRWEDD